MGNEDSGRWFLHTKRKTVEQVTFISIKDLHQAYGKGVSGFPDKTGIWRLNNWLINFVVHRIDGQLAMSLSFSYIVDKIQYDRTLVVPISTTECNLGGVRYWFHCPFCGRRIAILYQDGGAFACRQCHELTYNSVQVPKRNFGQMLLRMEKMAQRSTTWFDRYEAKIAKESAKNERRKAQARS